MRLFGILFLTLAVSSEAKKRRTEKTKHKINENKDQFEVTPTYDSNDAKFRHPVPFGHIYKEGYEDPRSGHLSPIDLMEFNTRYVEDGPYARQFIKNRPKNYQVLNERLIPNINTPPNFPNPDMNFQEEPAVATKNDSIKTYWNMEALLLRNLEEPPKYRIGGGGRPRPRIIQDDNDEAGVGPSVQRNEEILADQSFQIKKKGNNFTTCDEFGKRARFHPNDVVNVNWVPFYIWTNELNGRMLASRVHQFSFPTVKFVNNTKNYASLLNKIVDWEQPKLLMKYEAMEMLLIAVDRSGLFNGIVSSNLPKDENDKIPDMKFPVLELRLKIVDPYLAMIYCDSQYAIIMATSGSEPRDLKNCISEAGKLKLVGKGLPVLRNPYMESRAKMADAIQNKQDPFIRLEDQYDDVGTQLKL